MPKFRVYVAETVTGYIDVEAGDRDEAMDKVESGDYDDICPTGGDYGDVEIVDVEKLKE